jgi:hypothetical protein
MTQEQLRLACLGHTLGNGGLNVPELKALARERGHSGTSKMDRAQLLKILCGDEKDENPTVPSMKKMRVPALAPPVPAPPVQSPIIMAIRMSGLVDEKNYMVFKEREGLSADIQQVFDDHGDQAFNNLRELVEWLDTVAATSDVKGAVATYIMGEDLTRRVSGRGDSLLEIIDRFPAESRIFNKGPFFFDETSVSGVHLRAILVEDGEMEFSNLREFVTWVKTKTHRLKVEDTDKLISTVIGPAITKEIKLLGPKAPAKKYKISGGPQKADSLTYNQLYLMIASDIRAESLTDEERSQRRILIDRHKDIYTADQLFKLARVKHNPPLPSFIHGDISTVGNYMPQTNPFEPYGKYKEMSLYKIKAGTTFYHGSNANIRDFDRAAFFSLVVGYVKSLMVAGRAFDVHGPRPPKFNDIKIYKLLLKKDIVLIYNKHIWGECGDPECGPLDDNESITDFCSLFGAHGFFQMRVIAPAPPLSDVGGLESVLRDGSSINQVSVRDKIRRGSSTFESYFSKYVDYNKGDKEKPRWHFHSGIKAPEIVLCRPKDVLNLISITTVPGEDLIDQQRRHVLNLLEKVDKKYYAGYEAGYQFYCDLLANW